MQTLDSLLDNDEIIIKYKRLTKNPSEYLISNITLDSRKFLHESDNNFQIFFAIQGTKYNGNDFIINICKKNKNIIIISEEFNDKAENFLQINDINKSIGIIAKKFFQSPDNELKTFAITGTNGKSTIGFLLRHILNTTAKTGLSGTIEYDLGDKPFEGTNTTPDAITFYGNMRRAITNKCKFFVTEISSHALALNRAYKFQPTVAIFTNLTPEHLDFHKNIENYFQSKMKLFSDENGHSPIFSVINIDDEFGKKLTNILQNTNIITYGFDKNADFFIESICQNDIAGTIFTLKHKNEQFQIKTELIGKFNANNITAAIATCNAIGIDIHSIIKSIENFEGTPGRLQKIKETKKIHVFIDYAHTADALENILKELQIVKTHHIITVFGCGGDRDKTKRAPMTKIANTLSDFAIATSDNTRSEDINDIFKSMSSGIIDKSKIEFISDRKHAIIHAIKMAKTGDIVLIAGRGHEKLQKIGNKLVNFDDYITTKQIILKDLK